MTPSVFDDFFKPWNEWFGNGNSWIKELTTPAVNVTEKDDQYLVSMAVPGLKKEDFNINIEGKMLTISSEKESSKEEKEEKYTRKEYNYSSFSRSFTIPEDVRQENIQANYENGELKLTLPRTDKSRKESPLKTIAVK
jgi:HSP20 family protein